MGQPFTLTIVTSDMRAKLARRAKTMDRIMCFEERVSKIMVGWNRSDGTYRTLRLRAEGIAEKQLGYRC